MLPLICAVDVGTRSARAGILDRTGRLLGRAEFPIRLNEPRHGHAEHQSEDIWRAVCAAVRGARRAADVAAGDIAGIGFDATCSLVVRDTALRPLPVSVAGDETWDTISWIDHRALAEAAECTASRHSALDAMGGVMSPEMQPPKAMWLKRHLPNIWSRTGHLFDLADYLSWRASGSTARSLCTLTCKWPYFARDREAWQRGFLARVGLADLMERGGLPDRALPAGTDLGPLSIEAADALGLTQRCRVAVGLVDAFAGALGLFGPHVLGNGDLPGHAALIAGTSSCVMTLSRRPHRLAGFWGPYADVTLPGYFMTEGGQSATGALLDHLVRVHAAGGQPTAERHEAIIERVRVLRAAEGAFAAGLHVLPDFHGNRSPLARPGARGVISGLTLDASFDGLCALYWRTCVGIGLGVRHILEAMAAGGHAIHTLHVTGGHTRNPLLMELYADATGCRLVETSAHDGVLLGTAMTAACGAGLFPSLAEACLGMRQPTRERGPDVMVKARYDLDYRVFLEMQRQRRALEEID